MTANLLHPRLRCPKCQGRLLDAWYITQRDGKLVAWGICQTHKKLAIGQIPGLPIRHTLSKVQKRQGMKAVPRPNAAQPPNPPAESPDWIYKDLLHFSKTAQANLESPIFLVASYLKWMDAVGSERETYKYQKFPKEMLEAARKIC